MTHAPECLTCTAYHGGAFVCAIHPSGPTRRPCPDYVQGPRYRRALEIRHVEEPVKPPGAASESAAAFAAIAGAPMSEAERAMIDAVRIPTSGPVHPLPRHTWAIPTRSRRTWWMGLVELLRGWAP